MSIGVLAPGLVLALACSGADGAIRLKSAGMYNLFHHDFNGDGRADVAELEGRSLRIYLTPPGAFAAPARPQLTFVLPDEIAVVGAARPSKDSRFAEWIGLSRSGIWKVDKTEAGQSFRLAVETPLSLPGEFPAPRMSAIAMDLNGDGLDELLAPEPEGLGVWKRAGQSKSASQDSSESGAFRRAALVPVNGGAHLIYQSSPRWEALFPVLQPDGRVVSIGSRPTASWTGGAWEMTSGRWGPGFTFSAEDRNGDGLLDLIGLEGATFLQKKEPELTFSRSGGGEMNWSNYGDFTFMADFDGDGAVDGLTIVGEESLARPRTHVRFYRNRFPEPFSPAPDESMITSDFTYLPQSVPVVDFNNDGRLDLLLTRLDLNAPNAQSNLRAYFQKGLKVDLRVYLWNTDKNFFDRRPAFEHRLKFKYEIFGLLSEDDFPLVADHDLTGDGLPDLVTKRAMDEVGLYPQRSKNRGFESRPARLRRVEHAVRSLYPREIDGQAPIEILCLSPADERGESRASVIHWDL